MSFSTGLIPYNGSNTNGSPGGSSGVNFQELIAAFQVQDCSGTSVGDPIKAMQAVIMNKVMVSVCNFGNYNTPYRKSIIDGQQVTLQKNRYHGIAFKVLNGSGTIKLGNSAAEAIEAGEADEWTAIGTLNQDFVFACTTGKIVITAIGPDGEFSDDFNDDFNV